MLWVEVIYLRKMYDVGKPENNNEQYINVIKINFSLEL